MKKLFLAVFITASALTMTSCSKSSHDSNPSGNTPNGSVSRIKTWVSDTHTSDYTYDAPGRCILVSRNNGAKTTYDYSPGKMVQKSFNTAGVNDVTYIYELNSDGLAVKETRPGQPDFMETRTYNANKQIIKTVSQENGNIHAIDYFYSNGNLDSSRYSHNGTWTYTNCATFYTDKLNSISNEAFGSLLSGTGNKNLLKTEQNKFSDGSVSALENYSYEFDAKGRVSKVISVTAGNPEEFQYVTYY